MTRERPKGSASAGLQQIGKITTVLGTRCFSGLTGSHGLSRFFGRVPSQGA
jgi:hypothetical protein